MLFNWSEIEKQLGILNLKIQYHTLHLLALQRELF